MTDNANLQGPNGVTNEAGNVDIHTTGNNR